MCETKGFVPKLLVGRGQRKQAPQACQCAQPAPALSLTQYAQRVLIIVAAVVVLAKAAAIVHMLLIGVAVIFGVAVLGAVWLLVRRVRALRQPVIIPAPQPGLEIRNGITDLPVRTMVTHVNGQAIGSGRERSSGSLTGSLPAGRSPGRGIDSRP